MVVKVLKLVVLFLIVVYSNTAPVNTSLRGTTTTATDLPAYCSRNISICRVDINKLYTESDKIYDLLVDELCPMTKCGSECDKTPTFQLAEDKDKQNDLINAQLLKINGQLSLLESHCKSYSDITSDENPLMYGLCASLHSKLQLFTEYISQYLENEKCGCNPKCCYKYGSQLDSDAVPPQQVPCMVYKAMKLTQEIINAIRIKAIKI